MAEDKGFTVTDKRRTGGNETADAPSTPPPPDRADTASKSSGPIEITFSTFVLSLSTSAAMNLSGYADPVSGHIPRNLELAKQSIDILGIIKDKTKGNLDADESSLLESVLYELRMRYIDEIKKGG